MERDAIRQRETAALIGRLMRIRVGILSLVALFLGFVIASGSSAVRFALIPVLLGVGFVAYADYRRIGRYDVRTVPVDLAIVVSVQTLLICMTGGVESPVVFVYVLVALAAGASLGAARPAFGLIAYISFLIWLVTLLGFGGLLPKLVPDFLRLGPGFVDRKLYVITTMGALNVGAFAAFRVGCLIHDTINRMIDDAIGARQNALERLGAQNSELLRLSSAIAHELKNPLASIQGLVQLLSRGGKNSVERLAVLDREVVRMRETLDGFLNFSRPLGDLTLEHVSVRDLMRELGLLHEGLVEVKRARLDLPEADLTVTADRRKLEQALVNLLQNAIEAVPDGGRLRWIAKTEADHVEIGVEDDGPGIDAKLRAHLERSGTTTKPTGSGIGLTVVRTIAEQHGGSLVLQNRPEGGTRAVLSLPR